ncbi:bacterial SH3 domain protein [Kordia sp. SMS9]|uniref:SH3 domain-containing protein n=1 Tax=Kordia sp. SMS9 TaxID=2282170 RepID=UPI000E0DD00E|nr:SH3 domain-containing protein [Kordia sp. SMS9]AXG72459.1 bacterial SH3 domain protein [Kordia sp. SMS9]
MKTFTLQTLFFFFFVCATQLNAQQSDYIYLYNDLQVNETYSLFGDNVNLRAKPSTTSKEITRLRIGFEIKIIAKTAAIFESNNSKTYWYEVQYKDLKGFIPEKFIAHKTIKNNTHSYFFHKKISKTYGDQLAIRTLVGDAYNKYTENLVQLRGSLITAELEGNHDLKNIKEILTIKYHGESCGAENGITYFFLKENYELVHIAHLSVSGDIGFFDSETFTFTTNEHNGQPIILFTKEAGETIDEDTNWVESKTLTRQFEWDGTKLVPEFSKKFYRPKKSN